MVLVGKPEERRLLAKSRRSRGIILKLILIRIGGYGLNSSGS
jgi:hypothetical protein